MTMLTTEPGVQFYSGNFLGRAVRAMSAVCLEAQHYTDSPNQPAFPTTVLRPDEGFASRTLYRFDAGWVGERSGGHACATTDACQLPPTP